MLVSHYGPPPLTQLPADGDAAHHVSHANSSRPRRLPSSTFGTARCRRWARARTLPANPPTRRTRRLGALRSAAQYLRLDLLILSVAHDASVQKLLGTL